MEASTQQEKSSGTSNIGPPSTSAPLQIHPQHLPESRDAGEGTFDCDSRDASQWPQQDGCDPSSVLWHGMPAWHRYGQASIASESQACNKCAIIAESKSDQCKSTLLYPTFRRHEGQSVFGVAIILPASFR